MKFTLLLKPSSSHSFFCLISVVGFIRKCRLQCMLIACIRDRHTYTATTTQCRLLVCKQKYFTAQINKWLFSFIWLFVFMSFSFPSLRQSCAKERKNEKKDVISTTIKFMPDNYARIYFMNLCKTEKCKKATFYCFFSPLFPYENGCECDIAPGLSSNKPLLLNLCSCVQLWK